MTTVTVSTGVPIQLGYQYDDYATEVVFPASIIEPFTTTYGSGGTFAIWYRRSGDATGYPIGNPLVVFNGTTVTWTVVETDVANPGQAQVQLRYIKDEHCVMSQMFTAIVEDSVDIGTEIPEPMEQWADAIIKAGSGGQPTVVTSSSAMTSHSAIYLYMGNEGGYQYGHIYYWDGTYWVDGGAYGGGSTGSGLTEGVKQALLACFENVAWVSEDGQDYVDALESALYPPAELQSITATYTQSGTVYDTDSLDSLKADLVVTANYDNGTSATVTTYTLSGTLAEGTSTITVSYGGKTTTFTVVDVLSLTLPSGYVQHDFIRMTSTATKPSDRWIRLNSYTDLNELSLDITFARYSNGSQSGNSAFFGVRADSEFVHSFSAYLKTDFALSCAIRGTSFETTDTVPIDTPSRFIMRNPQTSPVYAKLNNGTEITVPWESSVPITYAPVLFTNPAPTATEMALSKFIKIGTIILKDYNNHTVGYYVPVVYNNIIGMYDFVSETFYSTSASQYATVGNSNCIYAVGEWS